MWPIRNSVSPVRMHGSALPVRAVVLQFRKQQKEFREDVLIPRRISGHEGIGQLFEYRVEAVRRAPNPDYVWNDDAPIDPDALKGTAITLTFSNVYRKPRDCASARDRTGDREISGMIASANRLGTEGSTVVYELVIRPWWWRATLCKNSRIFTGLEAEIVHIIYTVLKPYSSDIDLRVGHKTGPLRDFIRQAWETDWDFCMRLCEEFGYVIWFEHDDGRHVLVIAESLRDCHKHSHPYETLHYRPTGGHLDREHLTHLSSGTSVAASTVTVHDHSYASPRLHRHSLPYRENYGIAHDDEARLESYEPAEYAQPDTSAYVQQDETSWHEDARYLARVKLEAARCARLRAKGRGALHGIETGKTFTLTDHPDDEANGEYLVLDCRLDIRGTPGTSTTLPEYSFEAEFGLHPTSEPWRMPQITPRPHIGGYEHAVIVGYADQPLTIDPYNRVRIQFAWDREGEYDGKSSIWVQILQPWQGNQMGLIMHGRPGQPVLVAYINGDPDRPIVAGFAPDALNMPPWKLPENQALTGIVSRTLGPGNPSNHLALDDTENRQQAQLASDHAKSSLSLGYITRIEGHAGRQDARGEGYELRTDKHGVLRAALGLFLTTIAKIGAAGKVKDMSETIARLTHSRDIHESLAQQAQRHGAQNATGDQSDVSADMRRANAELRGEPNPGRDEFPEFAAPHLTLSSVAGIQTAAAGSTHIASDEHTALTAGGHVSIAAGKSLLASVREKIAFYGEKAITFVTPGRVHVESSSADLRLIAQQVIEMVSKEEWLRLLSPKGIELRGGDSVLRISSEGITGYTHGQFLVHAADHATDAPASRPVDFPVTPESPGKLAAHYVLVEEGSGFVIPNQPYRLTLDDGQVIEGATNELGELQMVTSHAVAFGIIELMSQSEPEDVIAVTNFSVYRDTSSSPPPIAPVAAKRSVQVGGKAITTPDDGPTTQGKPAEYFSCDPLNFGLRSYRLINGAKKEDTPLNYDYRGSIEYPVAKKYTAAVKAALMAIKWDELIGKSAREVGAAAIPAIQPALWDALTSGLFGLPEGTSESVNIRGAMPESIIITPENATEYGMKPNYLGGFISGFWVIAVNISILNRIVANENNLRITNIQELAETFYHEARHCQQKFWMISLFSSHREDYRKFAKLEEYYKNTVREEVYDLASKKPLPDDDRVRIGIHRMLVFDYYWSILGGLNTPRLQPCLPDKEIVEAEVCMMLDTTPEQARQMADGNRGYRSHLHEEDAFACGELVDSYWNDPDRAQLRNPGTCTKEYREVIGRIRGISNA